MDELLVSRKRLVFDEFLFFILSVQLLKEKTEEAVNLFPIKKNMDNRAGDRKSSLQAYQCPAEYLA